MRVWGFLPPTTNYLTILLNQQNSHNCLVGSIFKHNLFHQIAQQIS